MGNFFFRGAKLRRIDSMLYDSIDLFDLLALYVCGIPSSQDKVFHSTTTFILE